MKERLKIKVCGMRDPKNIKEVANVGVHYLGFIFFEKSPRNISHTEPISLPIEGVRKIGVFVNASSSFILGKAKEMNLWGIQMHGNETPEQCEEIKKSGYQVLKAFGIDTSFDFSVLEPYEKSCDFFLFDTKSESHGGTGLKFNWDVLRKYNNKKPVFLSGGITSTDAEQIKKLSWLNIHALDINSKFEDEPALKNVKLIEQFISELNV